MTETLRKTADLSTEEKRALLARLLRDKADAARSRDASAHRMIETQAARSPDAIAVQAGDSRLSYRQLNLRAQRLARKLQQLGARPDATVALCLDRSPDLIVALLAVLKAGAAYIPLDPLYPPDRIAFMIRDANPTILLTQDRYRELLPLDDGDATLLSIDDEPIQALLDGNGNGNRDDDDEELPRLLNTHQVAPANLAYTIYTSGSTGKPKGVQIPHAALANFLLSLANILDLKPSDRLLAVTTLSFDIAALECFLPLTRGATILLASRDEAADGNRLIRRIQRDHPTLLQATPATWRLLLEAGWDGLPDLRILCGGEALPRELADRLLTRGHALWNLYGPTETTIWSTASRVEPGDGVVPIGKPIANTRVYVLDSQLRPTPLGVVGELYIGGLGLARGYHARPGLTAERFLPDPVGDEPGARVYRTGDLARWRADGRLECLGRVDHQVKIRGFRIELGEVEEALLAHDGVREAVAVALEDGTGENRLIAYVVPRAGEPGAPAFAVADLRRALQQTLPEPMVPSIFVLLEALPLTPNGKVDRKALPDPDQAGAATAGIYVPPRGPIEEALAAAWGEVLGRDRIGVHDGFFELGGHSLLAARLLARIRDTFAVEVPLRDLFDNPTVAGQGRRIEAAMREGAGAQAPPLRPIARDGDLPASFAQQRLWFLDQLEPGSPLYSIPLALRLTGALDAATLEKALNALVRRHESLRTTFHARDGQPFQVIAPELAIPLPLVDLSSTDKVNREAEVLRRIGDEARRPFDLARGPLLRGLLIRLGEAEHIVLLNLHHIIADGWSLGVLIHEAGSLYDAFTRDRPDPLAPLPVQYADFAAWQRQWLQGDVLRDQLDYWKAQLEGVPPLELATDHPRPAILSYRGDERKRLLPRDLVASLRDLGARENTTFFMTLLAAFEALLHRYSGQRDFAIGAPMAGRTHSETESLIGFFVNTLVLRADLSGDPSFRDLLARAKRATLGAFAHQDLPFEKLVEVLHPARDPGRSPLFQVMLVLQNAPLPTLDSAELTMTPLEALSGTAKFELTLFAKEEEGGLLAALEYNADLYDAATIERMLGHFQILLEAIVADPDRAIAALPMLSDAERKLILGQSDSDGDGPSFSVADLDGLSDEELDALMNEFPLGDATDE